MFHYTLVCVFGDHGRGTIVLGVDVVVQIADNRRPLLLGLLVQVGNSDTSCQDGVVGVGDGHVRSCFSGLQSALVQSLLTGRVEVWLLTRSSSWTVVTPP